MTLLSEPDKLDRLLQKCRKGDQKAWSEIVDGFQRLVYSIPKRMGLSDDEAGDVFQITFTALYRYLDRIESAQTLPKWLSVTASREAIRIKRMRSPSIDLGDMTLDEIVADEEQSAERTAVDAEQSESLWQGVGDLDPRCKELLTSLYANELSYTEISENVGIPIGAIGPTRSRCLEKLRKILTKKGFFE